MKKIFVTALVAAATSGVFAQSNTKIQWGLSLSTIHNYSQFKGGNSNAHARFHHNDYNGGEWQISVRKDLNDKIFLQSGLGFAELGFSNAITNNYSLLNKDKHYTTLNQKWTEGFIPVMGFYQSKLNCRNWRWVAGAGFSTAFHGKLQTFTSTNDQANTGDAVNTTSGQTLSQTSNAVKYAQLKGLLSVGMEKKFKNNQVFGLYFIFSAGTQKIANSYVEYTLDNQTYKHQFANNGHYSGLRLSYFFRTKVKN